MSQGLANGMDSFDEDMYSRSEEDEKKDVRQ